ncbi:MAG: hypothetical protein ACTSWN_15050, partial [Promethearchaeota archaeon]
VIDPEVIKDNILSAIIELAGDDGVTMDVLRQELDLEENVLKSLIKEMVNEGMIERIKEDPETYLPN